MVHFGYDPLFRVLAHCLSNTCNEGVENHLLDCSPGVRVRVHAPDDQVKDLVSLVIDVESAHFGFKESEWVGPEERPVGSIIETTILSEGSLLEDDDVEG
jgi:hypothetical protein